MLPASEYAAVVCVLVALLAQGEGVLAAFPRNVIPSPKSSSWSVLNAAPPEALVKKNSVSTSADSSLSGYLTYASYTKTDCDGYPGVVVGWELNTCLGTDENLWIIMTATGTTNDFDVTESVYSDIDCNNPTGESVTYINQVPGCFECSALNMTSTYACDGVGSFGSYFFQVNSNVYRQNKDNDAVEFFYYEDTSSCKKNKKSTGGKLQEYVYIGQDTCVTADASGQESDAIYSCNNKNNDNVQVIITTFDSTDGTCTGSSKTNKQTVSMNAGCKSAEEADNGMFAYIECSGKSSNGNGSAEKEVEDLPVGVILAICFGILFVCAVCLIQLNNKRASDEERMLRTNPGDKKVVVLFSNRA